MTRIDKQNSIVAIGSMCSGKTYFTNSLLELNKKLTLEEKNEIMNEKDTFFRVGFDQISQGTILPILDLLKERNLEYEGKIYKNLRDYYKERLSDLTENDFEKINHSFLNYFNDWALVPTDEEKKEQEKIVKDFINRFSYKGDTKLFEMTAKKILYQNSVIPSDFLKLLNDEKFDMSNLGFVTDFIASKIEGKTKLDITSSDVFERVEKETGIKDVLPKFIEAKFNELTAENSPTREYYHKLSSMLEIALFTNANAGKEKGYYIFDLGGGQTDYRNRDYFTQEQNEKMQEFGNIVKNILDKTNLVEISPIRKEITKDFEKLSDDEKKELKQRLIEEKIKNSKKRHSENEAEIVEIEKESITDFEENEVNYKYDIKYNFATYEDNAKDFIKNVIKENEKQIENNDKGLYTLDEIKKNMPAFAKKFSEGNKELEKLLLKLWENNIPTIACCGHEPVFFGKSHHSGNFVFFEKSAYIAIDTTNMKKGVTFKNMASKICSDKNLTYEVDEIDGKFRRNALTMYQEGLSTSKFFKNINDMLDVFLPLENKKDKNQINLEDYESTEHISTRIITNTDPTKKMSFMHDGKTYEVLNFRQGYRRNAFVLYDTYTNPKQIAGYAVYNFNKENNNLALEYFTIRSDLRHQGLGKKFLNNFEKMIKENFDEKINMMFVHPVSEEEKYQSKLEDFYQQNGFRLTNDNPIKYIFCPKEYSGYISKFNQNIEKAMNEVGTKESIQEKTLNHNKEER